MMKDLDINKKMNHIYLLDLSTNQKSFVERLLKICEQ